MIYIIISMLVLAPFLTNATGIKYCKKHKCEVPPIVATTTPPVATSTLPVSTTTPVATTTLPTATTTTPIATTTPVTSTSTPVSTSTPPISPITEPVKPLGNGAIYCSGPTAPGWNVSLPNGGCNQNTIKINHIDPTTFKQPIVGSVSTTSIEAKRIELLKELLNLMKSLLEIMKQNELKYGKG